MKDSSHDHAEPTRYDVAIVGGALSGSATALLLLQRNPELRILIVESNLRHQRRVGESTVEVSSYFLGQILGLSGELSRNHISKQGLRFHFANDEAQHFHECSEVGPKFNVLFPGYQIDRAQLDEHVLEKAVARGAELLRPAKVTEIDLQPGGLQTLTIQQDKQTRLIHARWIVDASGVRALVARKRGWIHTNTQHPIATAWSRWSGVPDWDGEELAAEAPAWSKRVFGIRNNATNHIIGKGWWAWMIPLQNGDVSIGIVYDQRIVELKAGDRVGNRLKSMLSEHPVGERFLRNATFIKGDVKFRRNFSYYSEKAAGDGFALIGDALGFIDPFYSPGIDWLCYSSMGAAQLIAEQISQPTTCPKRLDGYNRQFSDSYHRWFKAIYKDKYYYMGDYELMKIAFKLDLGFYYLGAVGRPFILGPESLATPSFGQKEGKWPAKIIGFYNRRLATIGKRRMASGRWGRHNAHRHFNFFSYRLNWTLPARLLLALVHYAWLECAEFAASPFASGEKRP